MPHIEIPGLCAQPCPLALPVRFSSHPVLQAPHADRIP